MKKIYVFPPKLSDTCELQPDSLSEPIVGVPDHHPANGADCQSFSVPDSVPNLNGANLQIANYPKLHGILDFTHGGVIVDVFPPLTQRSNVPFVLDGQFPRLVTGAELLISHATGFRAFSRFVNEEFQQLDAFCDSLRDNYVNFIRFSLLQDTSLYLSDPRLQYRIHPSDHLAYYELLHQFVAEYLPGYGLYPSAVAFMQTQTLMPDLSDQTRHLMQSYDVMMDVPGLFSMVNEQGIHDNSVQSPLFFMPPPNGRAFLMSNGSLGAGEKKMLTPIRDFIEFHTNDLNEWQRKSKDTMDIANAHGYDGNGGSCAGLTSEVTRTDKDPNVNRFEDDADVGASMTMGATIHTPEGKNADPFDQSLRHVHAYNRGLGKGGVLFRRGRYSRNENNPPGVIRVYTMSVDVGAHTIEVRES